MEGGIPSIVDFAVRQWRLTMAFLALTVIGGFFAMFDIPLDADPDVAVPFVTVQVILPGVSPEDSERLIVKPLETELKSLNGIKELSGRAYTSSGNIILEFNPDFEQAEAVADVLEAVDKARGELPEDAKEPIVDEVNTQTLPIIVINIFGNAPDRDLQLRAKKLKNLLESNPKVLEAVIQGEREELLEAVIDPGLVESFGITFGEISSAISRNNKLVPAGNLQTESGKFAVKLPGLIVTKEDLASIVIRTEAGGSIVTMGDISNVRRSYKDRNSFARFNGQPSVSIEVSKRMGENIIDTIADVRQIVEMETADWPSNVQVRLSQDQTKTIVDLIKSLLSSIINAVVLVFIVCVAALGLRSALMVGFAIPSSFLLTLFFLDIQGASVNMMTMFAMVLSVGILVDSAIVIIEYADRKLAEGFNRTQAYTLAGKRMFWPIVSSTATTLAAFLPLLFWNTLEGQFMAYFPKTLIFVLSASMVMALIFLPTLGSLVGPKKVLNPRESLKALSASEGDPLSIEGFTGRYARLIDKLAHMPLRVLLVSALLIATIVFSFSQKEHKVEFFTASGGDQIYVYARDRGNSTPAAQLEVAKQVEASLQGIAGIKSVFSIAGDAATGGGFSRVGDAPVDAISRTFLELLPFEDRPTSDEIEVEINKALSQIPGLLTEIQVIDQGPPVGKDIAVELRSENLANLRSAAETLNAHMESLDTLTAVESTLPLPGIDWEIEIDRAEAGRLGLDVGTIGAAVQFVTEGSVVGFFRPLDSDEELDIRVRYPSNQRGLSALDTLRILTPEGALPLSSVVKKTPVTQTDSIQRRDQSRFYEVRANGIAGSAKNKTVADLKNWIATDMKIPDGVSYRFLGQDEESRNASAFFAKAGLATLFMMAVILLLQFNNFWQVFLTLSAVVISIFGVLLGWMFYPFISIMLGGTGILALAGIVVNNNIVLIDTFQRLQASGFSDHEAAVRTAAQRMRPVLLTTVTTVIGLMPMVLAIQADLFTGAFSTRGTSTSVIWAPISFVIVTGLSFATVLTLILTPVLLAAPALWSKSIRDFLNRNNTDALVDDPASIAQPKPA